MKGGLFASPDFLGLWLGQVASNTDFGISRVAMPLLAVGSVLLAWTLGALTVAQLYATSFVQGCAFVFANLC